ncbi:hypothetical protein [Archangium sp.]|uniref:hypothetical protein n=1 Tax=Archangium sp. TaxID=1872627 RepID=UPI002D26DD3A|nr:hypothetical protein [Archangium sp.]HYO56306.1 hypothetical protein [Archangium sp.]
MTDIQKQIVPPLRSPALLRLQLPEERPSHLSVACIAQGAQAFKPAVKQMEVA